MCKNAGFTLIELLVVVLIIGILASVALPQYQVAVAKSRYSTARAAVDAVWKAQQVYYMANGAYAAKFEDLDVSLPGGLRHTSTAGSAGDEIWENEDFAFVLRVDAGHGSYVYVRIKKAKENVKPQYFRRFNETQAKCYARASAKVWNSVCLSLGGKLSTADGFWNVYDL